MPSSLRRESVLSPSSPHQTTPPATPAPTLLASNATLLVTVFGGAAVAIAGVFLALWLSGVPAAMAWAAPRMKTNTALCLTAAAVALLRLRRAPWGAQPAIAAGVVSLVAGLTLVQIVFGATLGIDKILARDVPSPESAAFPNRMAPNTAVALLLLGWALMWIKSARRTRAFAGQFLTFAVLVISLLALIGYVYNAPALYQPTRFLRMSPYTAAVLVMLGLGTLGLRPDIGLLFILMKRDMAGYLARPLLLAATIVPILFGLVVVTGIRRGLFHWSLGIALLASSTIVAFVGVIGALARFIERVDQRRGLAEAGLLRAAELTAELSLAATVDQVIDITVRLGVPALEATAGGVYLMSQDGRELLLASTIGFEPETLDAYRVVPVSAPFPVATAARERRNVFLGTKAECLEAFPVMAGRLLPQSARVALLLEARGHVLGALVLTFDREHTFDEETRARLSSLASQCAQALDRARLFDSERAANHAKDEFLAMLGHELRNPLMPIITSLELMKIRGDAFVSERAIIGRHVLRLSRLVDDLMDVSRIAGGKVELRRAHLELHQCVSEALEAASLLFETGGLYVDVRVPKTGLPMFADPQRLTQVISNLLTNAAKYTNRGGHIKIEAHRTGDSAVLEVSDDGVGIPGALLPQIFDLFTQGQTTLARSQGGLGLGLAIARSVVQLHGGTIAAFSDGPGKGSTFTVTLPLDVSVPKPASPVVPAAPNIEEGTKTEGSGPPTCRILVVDDNHDAAETLANLLSLGGHDVRVAGDGPEALGILDAFEPQLIFLDIGLPVMDGWELAKTLRSITAGRPLTLVAMTGYGLDADRARSAEAGFDRHLVKPLNAAEVLKIASDTADQVE